MESHPEVIELDEADLESKLNQIEAALGVEMAQPFRHLLHWHVRLLGLLREKNLSIRRLQKLLFGASTERTSNVLSSAADSTAQAEEASAENSADHAACLPETSSTDGAQGEGSAKERPASRRRRPGHGRIPASDYTGCERVVVRHALLRPGDACPHCASGTVYQQSDCSPVVRLKGQAPITGKVYELERLRCGLCGEVFTAKLPEDAGAEKYDPSVAATVATLRYGEGMPWNRLQRLQQWAGIPLPASVQWELVRDAAEQGPRDAYRHLVALAAQGELIHNDDTTMRVLELTHKTKRQQPLLEADPQRRGVFTTGIVSVAEGRPDIVLFFTGPHHAGENLRALLQARVEELPLPIQMCDALSRNMPEDLRVILANCLAHGRRNFVEVVDSFPAEVQYVLECLKKVYQTDAEAKTQRLSPDERLRLHQERSQPVMEELHRWLKSQSDDRRVEPNSSLGGAISYMLRHWEKLTLFLRVPGAPLDNNVCERILKMAIRHRKNSLFYKTQRGAEVGDMYMSVVHTCYVSRVSPIDYLTALQRHHERVRASPGDWMPWNYRTQLALMESEADRRRDPSSDGPPCDGAPCDGPSSDAPSSDAPSSDAPSGDGPPADAPSGDGSSGDGPPNDGPPNDGPSSDGSSSDSSSSDGSSSDGSSGDGSSGDGSSSDGSSGDGPSSDGPSSDGPSSDGPSSDGPSSDAPSGDGPPNDGSSGDGSSGDGPSSDAPSGDGPPNNGPPADGSSGDGSSGDGSSSDGPSSDGPSSDGPPANGPSADGPSGDGSSGDGSSGDGSSGDAPSGDGSSGDGPPNDGPPSNARAP